MNSYQVPADPTAVMGRRIVAYLIDAILMALIALGVFLALADHETFPSSVASDVCSSVRNTADSPVLCANLGDEVYATEGGDSVVVIVVAAGVWIVNYLLLQGITGGTVGKHLLGIRCVKKSDGKPCGVGRALVRSLVGLFEIGFCFLIALITALTTKGHRRLGDMAADTLVVGARYAGQPPVVAGLTAAQYAGAGGYAPPPPGADWGSSYPTGSGWGTPPPPPPGAPWGAPVPPAPPSPPSSEPWAAPQSPPSPAAAPAESSPWATPAPSVSEPTTPEPSVWATPAAPASEPTREPAPATPADTSVFAAPGAAHDELPLDRESERDAEIAAVDAERERVWRPEPVNGHDAATEPVHSPADEPAAPTASSATAAGAAGPVSATSASAASSGAFGATDGAAAQSETPGVGSPTWDAARNAYIQWDPALSRWMQWDEAAREWRSIS